MSPQQRITLIIFTSLALAISSSVHAQWVKVNGPYGGPVSCLSKVGSTLLSDAGGALFMSEDGGLHWSSTDTTFYFSVNYITVKNSILYATTGRGVYRSTNAGLTWDSLAFNSMDFVGRIQSSETSLFVTTNWDVFRSSDDGRSWDTIPELEYQSIFDISSNNKLVCVGSYGCIFLSLDDGKSWDSLDLPHGGVFSVAFRGSSIFAGTEEGIYFSIDSGKTWASTDEPVPNDTVYSIRWLQSLLIAGTADGIYISRDTGSNWILSGLEGKDARLLWNNADTIFAGTIREALYRSTDFGATWLPANAGINGTGPRTLANIGRELFVATFEGVWRSGDNGDSWSPINNGISLTDGEVLASTGSVLFQGSYYGLYRSSDSGAHWDSFNNGLPHPAIYSMIADKDFLAIGTYDSGVYVWSEDENNWLSSNVGLKNGLKTRSVLAMIETDFGTFAALNGGSIFRSTNHGQTWVFCDSLGPAEFAFAADKKNIYVATYLGFGSCTVYRSTDSGVTWHETNFAAVGYPAIYCLTLINGNLFAGAEDGIYLTSDNGDSWTSVGYFSGYVNNLLLNNNYLFATSGANVWRRPLSEMLGQSAVAKTEATNQSLHCYPNPLSQSTTISFSPEASGYAEISIVNLLGVEVARVFSGELQAGEHQFVWQAQAKACATPGMYECVVRMNGHVETLPMMLLR
jgi:photosystem II stability/assembly factor-like uncharacterized protein